MVSEPFHILLIEDCPGDVGLVRHILKDMANRVELRVTPDGEDAMDLLCGPAAWIPDLIFLDLNLPKRPGLDVLRDLKSSADFRSIPVVILTSSCSDQDVQAAYTLGANSYITKPSGYDDFHSAITQAVTFWRSVAAPAPRHAHQQASA